MFFELVSPSVLANELYDASEKISCPGKKYDQELMINPQDEEENRWPVTWV